MNSFFSPTGTYCTNVGMEALFAAIEYYGRCNEVTQLRGG